MLVVNTLLVDDSPTVRKAIRYQFMAYGCRNFDEAESAFQALELMKKVSYQVVTYDLMMPLVGGISSEDAFAVMRREFTATAIVIISSIPYEKLKSEYLLKGATAYVVKPFTRFSFEHARRRLGRLFEQFL